MNKKKTIVVAIILLLVLLVGGMLAYFTDTDTKANVFVLGDDIDISLNESSWDASNADGIHPGTTVAKDPVIKNESATTSAYVFAEVIVPCYATAGTTVDAPLFLLNDSTGNALSTTVGSSGNSGWTLISTSSVDASSKTITYVYAWGSSSEMTTLAANTATSAPVFSSVTLEPTLTVAQKDTVETSDIVVNAYGIQIDGLSTSTPSSIYELF